MKKRLSLLCFDDLPVIYQNITLTFMADDRLVTTVTLSYGESFDPTKLPKVPEKKGYAGKWEDFNTSSLTFDQTINAVYTEYLSTLASSEKDDNGKALALVEGTFKEGDRFLLTDIDAYPEDSKTKAECKKISVLNGTGPFTVRYLIPDDIEMREIGTNGKVLLFRVPVISVAATTYSIRTSRNSSSPVWSGLLPCFPYSAVLQQVYC